MNGHCPGDVTTNSHGPGDVTINSYRTKGARGAHVVVRYCIPSRIHILLPLTNPGRKRILIFDKARLEVSDFIVFFSEKMVFLSSSDIFPCIHT